MAKWQSVAGDVAAMKAWPSIWRGYLNVWRESYDCRIMTILAGGIIDNQYQHRNINDVAA